MTNSEFTRKLKQLANTNNKAYQLRNECEEEYERRYGVNPSDAGDDTWIDIYHGIGETDPSLCSAQSVEERAVSYVGLKPYLKH